MTNDILAFIKSCFTSVISLMQSAIIINVTIDNVAYSLTLFDLFVSYLVFMLIIAVVVYFRGRNDD